MAQSAPAPAPVEEVFDVPLSVEAPIEPTTLRGDDGKVYIVYNLFLWNWSQTELNLDAVEAGAMSSN